jgi:hypothetical protein
VVEIHEVRKKPSQRMQSARCTRAVHGVTHESQYGLSRARSYLIRHGRFQVLRAA